MCTFQNLRVIAGNIHHLTVRIDKIFVVLNYVVQYILWLMLIFVPSAAGGSAHVLLFDSL